MTKRQVVAASILCGLAIAQHAAFGQDSLRDAANKSLQMNKMDCTKVADWEARWEKNILGEVRNRYCEKEMGEEIGWLMSPLLNGFYYGYMATGNAKWVGLLVNCTDAWIGRAVTEPDGYLGWPKVGAAGTAVDGLNDFYADSLLGEAMALRPVVRMSKQILISPRLKELYGAKAESYIGLSEKIFEKWNRRGGWRNSKAGGMTSVVLPFGIDQNASTWTNGYNSGNVSTNGFSHPNNKANLVAIWLLAMFDATQQPIYKERAEKWFRLMKSRMTLKDDSTYKIWNYWQPAGAWDYNGFGLPKHWIGVHPKDGYYDIDVEAIVAAFEHGIVFDEDDINHLIATALVEKRYWTALVPYSEEVRQNFENTINPESWDELLRSHGIGVSRAESGV